MAPNSPEVVGYCAKKDREPWERSNSYYLSPNPDENYTVPVIRLSDYEALQAEVERLRKDAERFRKVMNMTRAEREKVLFFACDRDVLNAIDDAR